jgi:phage terminase small subunit
MVAHKDLTPKQEAFAQAYVETGSPAESYREAYNAAGMKPTTIKVKASELLADPKVFARVKELRAARQALLDERYVALKERVIQEHVKIAFADIRSTVRWLGSLIQEEDNPEGGDVLVIKNIHSNAVQLISSDEIDDDTAAAIAEVSQSPTGGLKVKMHSKPAALDALVKILGMAVDKHEHTGKDGAPLLPENSASPRDLARAIMDIFRSAATENKDDPQ